jgi:hypothetical protein
MAKFCPDCIYCNTPDMTCRLKAPTPNPSGQAVEALWPEVSAADWCAEGYNATDGWYDAAPAASSPSSVTKVVR